MKVMIETDTGQIIWIHNIQCVIEPKQECKHLTLVMHNGPIKEIKKATISTMEIIPDD